MAFWVAGATVVAGVASGVMNSKASKSAANTAAASADAATAEQRRQYDQTRTDYSPYREVGVNALNKLGKLYGVQQQPQAQQAYSPWTGGSYDPSDPYGAMSSYYQPSQNVQVANAPQASADYSDFYNSPDYAFTRSEGLRGVQQSAAARGGAYSGNALRGITDYASGLASQQFGNYSNRLAALAGVGQSATAATAAAGSASANAIGQGLMASGDARASGIYASTNALTNGINTGINGLLSANRNGAISNYFSGSAKPSNVTYGNNVGISGGDLGYY